MNCCLEQYTVYNTWILTTLFRYYRNETHKTTWNFMLLHFLSLHQQSGYFRCKEKALTIYNQVFSNYQSRLVFKTFHWKWKWFLMLQMMVEKKLKCNLPGEREHISNYNYYVICFKNIYMYWGRQIISYVHLGPVDINIINFSNQHQHLMFPQFFIHKKKTLHIILNGKVLLYIFLNLILSFILITLPPFCIHDRHNKQTRCSRCFIYFKYPPN